MPPARHHRRNISPTTVIIAFTLFIFVSCSLINRQVNFYRIMATRLTDNSWDVYIFTQNWPPSVCLSWEEKGQGHLCYPSGNKTSWTIHGVWPSKFGTIGPSFCNNSLPFDPESIYGLRDELEERWTPVERHKARTSFWRHEWEKHGTCATTIPLYPNEFEYFNQGLQWNKLFNVTTALASAGITPGRQYNVTSIWSAVKQRFGKNPHISCFTDMATKTTYLLEVRVCFNKSLELADCDGIKQQTRWDHRRTHSGSGNFTGCHPDQIVEYPLTSQYPPPTDNHPVVDIFILDLLNFIRLIGWATS